MRLSHARRAIDVRFDDPNLVSCAGLVPVMALAQRCGLAALLVERLRIVAKGGANATAKVLALSTRPTCRTATRGRPAAPAAPPPSLAQS